MAELADAPDLDSDTIVRVFGLSATKINYDLMEIKHENQKIYNRQGLLFYQ